MSGMMDRTSQQMTHSKVEEFRHAGGKSILLFITDRCPVGCDHCSVDSREDSPTIRDFSLFEDILDWICAQAEMEVVGISGGEPFVERRGLALAASRLASAGKRLVVFTSGVWAKRPQPPRWIDDVLARCSCVYLSTDAFHVRHVDDKMFLRAARAVAAAGSWLVVQGLDDQETENRIAHLLEQAFGDAWSQCAEINLIQALTSGRGADVFSRTPHVAGHSFGPCPLVRSPMVRYDGIVTACCNENIIMGRGPNRLRQHLQSGNKLGEAIETFRKDALLQSIGNVGLGPLTGHPALCDLGDQTFATNCELCWKVLARMPDRNHPDMLVEAISVLPTETSP